MKMYRVYESFHNLLEKVTKSEPKGTKGIQEDNKREPKGAKVSQGEPKMSHLEAQGRQK